MRFKGLDLNLLAVLSILMETRSVARTAEKLNLSQPGISSALRRLRDYFGDDILVARGKRMYPRPLAESLLPQIHEGLRIMEGVIATSKTFDPRTSHRTFRIVVSDYVMVTVLGPLIARLAEEAPNVSIQIIQPAAEAGRLLEEGLIDLVVVREGQTSPAHPTELFLEEEFVVIGWDQNPLFESATITSEQFFACGHVGLRLGKLGSPSVADQHLNYLSANRRIAVTAASFTSIPWLLVDTMRLAVVPVRLAASFRRFFPIDVAALPFEFPSMRQTLQFHQTRENEQGITWMRALLRESVASPAPEPSP